MSSDNHVIELLPGYVLDCLDEEELILVSEHLPVCPDCQAELSAYQAVADELALALPKAAPSTSLKRQLADRIRLPQPDQPSRWNSFADFIRTATPVWGVVSLLLIVVLGTGSLLLWQRVSQLEAVTQPRQLQTINLAGTKIIPDASGLIVLSVDGRHGTLVVDHLPVLDPEQQQYQLWLIQDGQRASGAVFSVNKYGYGSVWVSSPEPLSSYSDFGISIEPAGGSPGPTGDKVLGRSIN